MYSHTNQLKFGTVSCWHHTSCPGCLHGSLWSECRLWSQPQVYTVYCSRTVVVFIYYSLSQLWATYKTSLSVLQIWVWGSMSEDEVQCLRMRFNDPFQKLKAMCDAQEVPVGNRRLWLYCFKVCNVTGLGYSYHMCKRSPNHAPCLELYTDFMAFLCCGFFFGFWSWRDLCHENSTVATLSWWFWSQSPIKCLDFPQQPQAQINRYLRCEPICLFQSAGNGAHAGGCK